MDDNKNDQNDPKLTEIQKHVKNKWEGLTPSKEKPKSEDKKIELSPEQIKELLDTELARQIQDEFDRKKLREETIDKIIKENEFAIENENRIPKVDPKIVINENEVPKIDPKIVEGIEGSSHKYDQTDSDDSGDKKKKSLLHNNILISDDYPLGTPLLFVLLAIIIIGPIVFFAFKNSDINIKSIGDNVKEYVQEYIPEGQDYGGEIILHCDDDDRSDSEELIRGLETKVATLKANYKSTKAKSKALKSKNRQLEKEVAALSSKITGNGSNDLNREIKKLKKRLYDSERMAESVDDKQCRYFDVWAKNFFREMQHKRPFHWRFEFRGNGKKPKCSYYNEQERLVEIDCMTQPRTRRRSNNDEKELEKLYKKRQIEEMMLRNKMKNMRL